MVLKTISVNQREGVSFCFGSSSWIMTVDHWIGMHVHHVFDMDADDDGGGDGGDSWLGSIDVHVVYVVLDPALMLPYHATSLRLLWSCSNMNGEVVGLFAHKGTVIFEKPYLLFCEVLDFSPASDTIFTKPYVQKCYRYRNTLTPQQFTPSTRKLSTPFFNPLQVFPTGYLFATSSHRQEPPPKRHG